MIEGCFDKNYIKALRISHDELFTLGRKDQEDKLEWFGMTPLALRMSRRANGVSRKHGEVSRELWKTLFPDKPNAADVPITHVTNGVHPGTWISPRFQKLYETNIGSNWKETLRDKNSWQAALGKISDEAIWKTHQLVKNKLIAFIRRRTFSENVGEREIISEHRSTLGLFHSNVLTIGFARRIAAYKRWNLLLTDIERLLATIDNESRPVQFVFAGKAHPSDEDGKLLLQNLIKQNHRAEWLRRAVFIEDYDQEVARHLVQGVDVWMNVPRRPLEASGTSGIKAAMNGALNFSVLDGWWLEAFDGENGFSIGADIRGETDIDEIDKLDAASLYEILEEQIIPIYYENDSAGRPHRWIQMMRNSLATITPRFSSDRMLDEYVTKIYA
jgi:starch phosphorylase